MGKQWKQWQALSSWSPKSLLMLTEAMKLKDTCPLEEKLWQTWTAHYLAKKRRHYLANKGLSSQSYGFSNSHVWMWVLDGKETWVLKNWCFWTVVLENTWLEPVLSIPWTARRSNQSTLKEISPEYSLEGLMLKLKLQHFGYLMRRTDLFQKTLMLGKIEGRRRRWQQRMRLWMASPT